MMYHHRYLIRLAQDLGIGLAFGLGIYLASVYLR